MKWNWQLPDWPNFTWDKARLAVAEEQFLVGGGVLIGTVKHLGEDDRNQLTVEAMSAEAVTTSEIEGEILDRASVQSSIQRQLGLAADNRRVSPSEQGTAEMMVDLYRTFSALLSEEMLFGWHRMLMSGRQDIKDVGCYRTSDEPMQVVSGVIGAPKIHFEAPPSAQVPHEMAGFIDWFKRTAPGGTQPLPALTRAGAAHLYFESIHPFEDGKGRIGRAIAEKSLAQNLGQPTLIVLAAAILVRRPSYYNALETANRQNEITNWLGWFGGVTIEAQRQQKALLRMFKEGPDGFKGGLSAGKYRHHHRGVAGNGDP